MNAREVLDYLHAKLVLAAREGDRIRLSAIHNDYPVEPETISLAAAHKQELLDYLRWEEAADLLLLEHTRRLAHSWTGQDELDPVWENYEKALHAAYWTHDTTLLKDVVRAREAYFLRSAVRSPTAHASQDLQKSVASEGGAS